MHRILLYALVVGLVCLAWDARRGEVLARASRTGSASPASTSSIVEGSTLASAAEDRSGRPREGFDSSRKSIGERFEARVGARSDLWASLELQAEPGPAPEAVLADAEKWMESNFPEGGRTSEAAARQGELGAASDLVGLQARASAAANQPRTEGKSGDATDASQQQSPLYIASLARIECLDGEVPAWCGLLELGLRPTARHPDLSSGSNSDTSGDTAWISDDHGKLLARVEALDGLGLEFDPSWPWIARERRLFWTERGASGLPVRQYRLILEGDGFGPSWSGRLVLVHSMPPRPPVQSTTHH